MICFRSILLNNFKFLVAQPAVVPQQRIVGKQLGATDEQMASGLMRNPKIEPTATASTTTIAMQQPLLQQQAPLLDAVVISDPVMDLALEGQKRRAARRLTEAAQSKSSSSSTVAATTTTTNSEHRGGSRHEDSTDRDSVRYNNNCVLQRN